MQNTPLILATLSGHGGIIRLLLKANCDVNKTGKSVGKTVKPIQIAVTLETLAIRWEACAPAAFSKKTHSWPVCGLVIR